MAWALQLSLNIISYKSVLQSYLPKVYINIVYKAELSMMLSLNFQNSYD